MTFCFKENRPAYHKRITKVNLKNKTMKKAFIQGFSFLDGGAYGTRTRDLLRDREAR